MDIPILSLLVTFLHELGHALAAIASGGSVTSLQVNLDGSGLCTTSGGNRALIASGGYLGSIIFGNLMLFIGIRHKYLSRILAGGLAVGMVLVSLIWFSTLESFAFTAIVGAILLVLFIKVKHSGRLFLILSGAYSVLYIIRDYQIGPSSDLQSFSSIMGLTSLIWMYVWLGMALLVTGFTLYRTIKIKA